MSVMKDLIFERMEFTCFQPLHKETVVVRSEGIYSRQRVQNAKAGKPSVGTELSWV